MSTAVLPVPDPTLSLQALHPGNFALVMASGIISIGFTMLGHD